MGQMDMGNGKTTLVKQTYMGNRNATDIWVKPIWAIGKQQICKANLFEQKKNHTVVLTTLACATAGIDMMTASYPS
jgi:hypothetical protein